MKPSLEQLYQKVSGNLYADSGDADTFIEDQEGLSAAEQLGIYRDSVRGGLIASLGDIFPAVKTALGETFFDAMSARYVKTHPSRSASLDNYGEQFPAYIAAFKPLEDYPYMEDVARIDWCWHRAFHAADPKTFDVAALSDIDPECLDRIRFRLQESIQTIASDFPVEKIWRLSRFPNSVDSNQEIDLSEGASWLVIYRAGLDTRVTSVDEVCYELLEAIKKGELFGTICEDSLSKHGQEQIQSALALLVQYQWISEFTLDPPTS